MSSKVKDDPRPSFPFSMVEKMMPMFPMIAIVGWAIVGISFLLGLFTLSPSVEDWFDAIKPTREADVDKISLWKDIHILETWLPDFKFLGLGFGLLAINMALGTIANKLRHMGKVISSHIDDDRRPNMPEIPRRVRLFQGSAMMGIMILFFTLLIGLFLAFITISEYYSVSQADLNAETTTSDLGTIEAIPHWLGPLRMVGMALLFIGITIALTVIINTLKYQNKVLSEL